MLRARDACTANLFFGGEEFLGDRELPGGSERMDVGALSKAAKLSDIAVGTRAAMNAFLDSCVSPANVGLRAAHGDMRCIVHHVPAL